MPVHRFCPVLLLALLLGAPQARAADIRLDAPVGGWRDSRMDNEQQVHVAAYPKPPVDRGGQKQRTLIRGKLPVSAAQRQPHTLVVNGTAMPLYSDNTGNFARPYAFGAGSNSVEVRSPQGGRQRLQFLEANAGKAAARVRLIMTWDNPQAEVDLHVVTPDGEHAYWARPLLKVGGGFDVDSVDGAGPEIFSSAAPTPGVWLLYVNYWGNFDDAGYTFDERRNGRPLITCTLSIVSHENTADEKRETYTVPLRRVGELTFIRRLQL